MNRRAVCFRRYAVMFLLMRSLSLPCSASDHGYDIWFAGQVLSIDMRQGIVRIARGPTETQGPAVIDCALARRALHRVYRGMQVDVEADTRSEPWRIIHLRPLEFLVHPLIHHWYT